MKNMLELLILMKGKSIDYFFPIRSVATDPLI